MSENSIKITRKYQTDLSKKQLKERGQKAVLNRYGFISATHSGVLTLNGFSVPCAVLKNGQRVVSSRSVIGLLLAILKAVYKDIYNLKIYNLICLKN